MNIANASDVTLRSMRVEDIPGVYEVEVEAFPTPWSQQAFVNELTFNQFAKYLVMEHEGRIIGYGGMWIIVDEAHITNIALREAYRGRGLGELLMAELAALAHRSGTARMTLEVRVSNEVAQRLYSKFGFHAVGRRIGYYTDNGEDALVMWADLPVSVG